ncbi:MAG: hypothetical protein EXR60_04770 [Dehalococcoidia bacterium]|nr:hypothetical protein [Dehalococcoidia bacterium]
MGPKSLLKAGLSLALVMISACGGEAPIESREVSVSLSDFTHPMSLVRSKQLTRDFDLVTASLRWDDKVRSDFANGVFTQYSQEFTWRDPRGNIVARKDCGDVPDELQYCRYYLGVDVYVLSFNTLKGARRAFQILAEPARAIVVEGTESTHTGERELLVSRIGDESRVFDRTNRTRYERPTTTIRVVARKDRIIVLVEGQEVKESRWGPGPIKAGYYGILASRVIERVEHLLPRDGR